MGRITRTYLCSGGSQNDLVKVFLGFSSMMFYVSKLNSCQLLFPIAVSRECAKACDVTRMRPRNFVPIKEQVLGFAVDRASNEQHANVRERPLSYTHSERKIHFCLRNTCDGDFLSLFAS